MQTLEVLFVTTSFPRTERDYCGSFVFRMAKCLAEAGVRVIVLAPAAPGVEPRSSWHGITVVRFPYFWPLGRQRLAYGDAGILSNLRNDWISWLQLPVFLLSMLVHTTRHLGSADIVHCHWLPTVWAAQGARLLTGRWRKPLVFTNWGSDTRLTASWVTRISVLGVNAFVSTAVETDLHLRAAGIRRIHTVMAPVDEDRFNAGADGSGVRSELGLDDTTPLISFIGRLNYFKDPLTFVDACGVLHNEGVRFRAVLAGDGDLRAECERRIKELEVDEVVTLLGARDDAECILAASTVSVHISPVENTWANVIAEGMFVGCPMLLSDAGSTSSTFTNDEDCVIVPASDARAVAQGLRMLVDHPERCTQLVEGARELLSRHGKDSASVTRNLLQCYEDVLASAVQ